MMNQNGNDISGGKEAGHTAPEPMVSIVIPAYQHERTIREAVMSAVEQKTSFPVEILVGEDASADRTGEILREMQPSLPERVHILFREKNLGMGWNGNLLTLIRSAKGKYIAVLEGDDRWTFPEKLQRQVSFLESHPEYVGTAHRCRVIGISGEPLTEKYIDCPAKEYTWHAFLQGFLPGQASSIVVRRSFYKETERYACSPVFYDGPGDWRKAFLMLMSGKVYCFQEYWSDYRFSPHAGSSYSASVSETASLRSRILLFESLKEYASLKRDEEAETAAGKAFYWEGLKRIMRGDARFPGKVFFRKLLKERHRFVYGGYILRRMLLVLGRGIAGAYTGCRDRLRMRRA